MKKQYIGTSLPEKVGDKTGGDGGQLDGERPFPPVDNKIIYPEAEMNLKESGLLETS